MITICVCIMTICEAKRQYEVGYNRIYLKKYAMQIFVFASNSCYNQCFDRLNLIESKIKQQLRPYSLPAAINQRPIFNEMQ